MNQFEALRQFGQAEDTDPLLARISSLASALAQHIASQMAQETAEVASWSANFARLVAQGEIGQDLSHYPEEDLRAFCALLLREEGLAKSFELAVRKMACTEKIRALVVKRGSGRAVTESYRADRAMRQVLPGAREARESRLLSWSEEVRLRGLEERAAKDAYFDRLRAAQAAGEKLTRKERLSLRSKPR